MLLGYARISTKNQNLDLQLDALRLHGCKSFFTDTVSWATSARLNSGMIQAKCDRCYRHRNRSLGW